MPCGSFKDSASVYIDVVDVWLYLYWFISQIILKLDKSHILRSSMISKINISKNVGIYVIES